MKLFCKKTQNFRALGAPPPNPRASGGWGLCPKTPIGRRRLGDPPPDPQNSPPIANFWLRAWCEDVFVELCSHDGIQYICGTVYRHPKCNFKTFNANLEIQIMQLNKDKKFTTLPVILMLISIGI